MRAFRLLEHGKAALVNHLIEPRPREGERVVDVIAAGINPLDLVVCKGLIAPDGPLPRTLGVEAVGLVDGRRVVVHGAGVGLLRDGTLTEKVVAPDIAIVPVPSGVPIEVAAACGVTGATAVRLVQLAEAQRGDRALVLAASGAMGFAISSLLSSRGIESWGQIRRREAEAFVKEAGAQPLLAETPDALPAALGERPTIVFDCLGGDWSAAAEGLLGFEGRHVIFGSATGATAQINLTSFYRRSGVMRGYAGVLEPPSRLREAVELALQAAADGHLRIPVGEQFQLHSAPEALERVAKSHQGKIIVRMEAH
jgi:NADPH2:quinone reductase